MAQVNPFLLQMVDEILFYEWDPIGINGQLMARDEYGSYAGGICRMLHEEVDEYKLSHHLQQIATMSMGLPETDLKHHRCIARRLLNALESCARRDPNGSSTRRGK